MNLRRVILILVGCCLALRGTSQVSYTYKMNATDKERLERAVSDYERGRYFKSAELLRTLSQKYPDNPDVYFYLGLNAVQRDFNVMGIRRYFSKVIQLSPEYPNAVAHYYMGLIHYTDDQFEEAVADFNRFFERANNNGTPETDSLYMEVSNYLYWSQFLADAYRNIVPFSPRIVATLSSPKDELLPFITYDRSACFFLRDTPEKSRTAYYSQEFTKQRLRLYVSEWRDTAYAPAVMLPSPFNQGDPEGSMTLTADNQELYYSVIRRERGYNNSDLYFTRRTAQGWEPIRNMGDSINGIGTWESQPSITPDGEWLYFASNRPGGMGGTDIWRAHRKEDGSWSSPENLGSSVNTPGNEKCPFIHADGHTLYFASDGWQGFGGYDMYFVDLDESGEPRPINMGLPINTEDDDIAIGITADGSLGYYAGRAPQEMAVGGNDIMTFELYPAARPEAMRVYRGQVTAPDGTPLKASLTVEHGSTSPARYHTDSEGRFSILISSKNDNTVIVSAPDYADRQLHISAHSRKASQPSVIMLTVNRETTRDDCRTIFTSKKNNE